MMTEWSIVEVIVVLIGLFVTVGKPMVNNTKAMTELNCSLKQLTDQQKETQDELEEFKDKNTESHRRLWKHNEQQDAKLNEHDKEIMLLKQQQQIDE